MTISTTSSGPLVLVVDDDPHIREVMRFALERAGLRVREAPDGRAALESCAREPPAVVVLDIMMPEMDGAEVCRHLRAPAAPRPYVPIIFVSSRDDEVDRVVGLELGGDDYLGKPFSPRELVARVRALLRRAAALGAAPAAGAEAATGGPRAPRVLRSGKLSLDLDAWRAFWEDREVVLTATEFGILRTLAGFPGKVFTRDELMDGAYDEANVVSDRTIDSHLRRVRRKLADVGADPIETVHGVGYQLRTST
jgi:two-component system OmpR family response regulator